MISLYLQRKAVQENMKIPDVFFGLSLTILLAGGAGSQ
jgi:hypothetical protein